jgi:hypothetical protein
MPLVPVGNGPRDIGLTPAPVQPQEETDLAAPGVGETLGAAWRSQNIIGSTINNQMIGADFDTIEPDFNPFEAAKGTPYEAYPERLASIFNRKAFESFKAQVDMEEEDRRTLQAAGGWGIVAQIGAGLLDPTMLIPAGTFVRSGKVGFSVARSAAAVGVGTAAGIAVQEGILQGTQETRTAGESALAIGGGAVLGALVGAAGAKLLDNVAWTSLATRISEDLAQQGPLPIDLNHAEMEALVDAVKSGSPASAGAATTFTRTLEDLSVAGRAAQAATQPIAKLNPLLRALYSPSARTRDIMLQMMENPIYLKMNLEGAASAQAVETVVKEYQGAYTVAYENTLKAWQEARKAGDAITWEEFRNRIGQAMRSNDTDAAGNAVISRMAAEWRESVFDPLKEKAIEAGLLPADVKVETAPSYFTRMWNVPKIESREQEFKRVVRDWVRGSVEAEVKRATESRDAKVARYNAIISDLELDRPTSAALLQTLPADLKALRSANQPFEAIDAAMAPLRSQEARARQAGDRATAQRLRTDIAARVQAAGKDYADYITKRNALASRIRRIRGNVVGREDQVEALRSRIADTEAANVDRLWRMHRALSSLERDMAKASPELLKEQIAKVRTEFAQVLERSTKAQDRLVSAQARKAEAAQKAAEAGDTAKAADIEDATAKAQATFERQEANRVSEMNDLADEVSRLEEIDPEEALNELRMLISRRIDQAADVVERAGQRIADLAKRAQEANPEKVKASVEALRRRIADVEARYNERVFVGLDADNGYQGYIDEVVTSIYNKITGREADAMPDVVHIPAAARGPLKERTFNIPDQKVADFLESDIESVGRRYVRTMGADVEMKAMLQRRGLDKFEELIGEIQADYERLRQGVTDERALRQLNAQERSDVKDLKAVYAIIKGSYLPEQNATTYAKIVNAAMTFNFMRTMGGVVLSSLTDIARPLMVHGLGRYMNDGVRPLVTNLKAFRMSAREAKLSGVVGERVRNAMLATYSELTDPYSRSSPFERFLDNAARGFSKLTGMPLWNDFMKSFSSVITQNRILDNVGKWGGLKDSERSYMLYLGLDQSMSERIAAQFTAHGEMIDNVRVANTEDWSDEVARRAYRAAVNKDVDSIIVTKGVGDVPLFARTPTGRAMLQFKGFALAAHQRALVRGLQESQLNMLSGLIAMTAIGAFIYYLKTAETNRWEDLSDNPGRWIAEGLDRSGFLSIPFEINNTAEKVGVPGVYTGLQAIFPNAMQRQPASRYAVRSVVDAYLGPTVGLAKDAIDLLGAAAKMDLSPADVNTMRRLTPGATLPFIRSLVEYGALPPAKEAVQ